MFRRVVIKRLYLAKEGAKVSERVASHRLTDETLSNEDRRLWTFALNQYKDKAHELSNLYQLALDIVNYQK